MLHNRNLLEKVSIISITGIFVCVVIYFVTDISPIKGQWFLGYLLLMFIISFVISFKGLHWILHLNRPLKYDLESFVQAYPYLSLLTKALPKLPQRKLREDKEYDTNELSVITTVLEKKLVSSWYVPYVSEEISFPFACKQMLDQMVGKAFQICNKIETKDLYVDVCVVLTTHLNEYKKALRRHEKCPENSIESCYNKSHVISDVTKKVTSADHCTNILRVVLKHLIPWELWDSPQSELLVRILSKRLDSFIEDTLANPAWLNRQLITVLKGPTESAKPNIDKPEAVKEMNEPVQVHDEEVPVVADCTDQEIPETTKDISTAEEPSQVAKNELVQSISIQVPTSNTPLSAELAQSANESLGAIQEEDKKTETQTTGENEPIEIKATNSPVLRQRRGRQGRNEVKIYDRIIEGSIKTWETDMDLQCLSVGQDLLAQLDGEMALGRLWGHDADERAPRALWFGEDELDTEAEGAADRREVSTPADALLKDLQSTVREAKHKIGDLQVSTPIDVPRPADEAAGVMEGLLDLGLAGLKKGLRLTRRHDEQDKSPTSLARERPSPDRPQHAAPRELNGNGGPLLMKQNRVTSQDSVAAAALRGESPEPQYEEAADLSASIAKLRCLLGQSPREYAAEEAWWERSPHALVDSAALADEFEVSAEPGEPGEPANNMQRLDRLLQRTVTGVFNSLRTAVGAEDEAAAAAAWLYVPAPCERAARVAGAAARLLGARRAAARVDAALDSLQQLAAPPPPPALDLDEWCAAAGAAWCASGGALAAAGLPSSHLAHALLTVLLADVGENLIAVRLDGLAERLRAQIFSAFERLGDEREGGPSRPAGEAGEEADAEEACRALLERFPWLAAAWGADAAGRAARLLAGAAGGAGGAARRDVLLRALDVAALHFHRAALRLH